MKICGIDPSINGSGFTLMDCNEDDYSVNELVQIGFTKKKKEEYHKNNLHVLLLDKNYSELPYHYRGEIILNMVMKYIDISEINYVAIEDYSYGSTGNTFDIAEFVGSIKNILYHNHIIYKKYPPSTVKGFATGKGAGDKVPMGIAYNALINVKYKLSELNDLNDYVSPKADLVDSFWMAQLLRYELFYLKNKTFPFDVSSNIDVILGGKKKVKTLPSIQHPFIEAHSVD